MVLNGIDFYIGPGPEIFTILGFDLNNDILIQETKLNNFVFRSPRRRQDQLPTFSSWRDLCRT